MNLEKVVFGFFIVLAATLNFGFFVGDIENPAHHDVYELFAALVVSLIATVLLLFMVQASAILANPLAIALIAIPLILQTYLIFWISAQWMRLWRQPHAIAAPGAMIGASNFFELAVAVAISLFGLNSGAALATVVGVLVEVPVMLSLVEIANRNTRLFPDRAG